MRRDSFRVLRPAHRLHYEIRELRVVMAVYKSLEAMPLFRYGLIMADPPWNFESWSDDGNTKGAAAQYECRQLEWIKRLPVGHIASPDCALWLWATNPMLPQALEVMKAWGFRFATAGHWSKKTKHGRQAFGTGHILRCAGEPFLIGSVGQPKYSNSVRSVIEGLIRAHSQKPDEAFAAAEALVPNVERCELFSRQERDGWDVMGDEVGKFAA